MTAARRALLVRWRAEAIRWITEPQASTPSQRALAWRVLKQRHPAARPGEVEV